jgi:polysaccharide chain length determinant protein (PEP-CTERM system associated)
MSEKSTSFQIGYYIDLALRHRWFIIIPFCLAMIAGIYLALTLPRIYMASTMIMVEPQAVPSNFVQSIVTTDISTRINSISQEIMSRSNLERAIKKMNLFSGPGYKKVFMEDMIASMRSRIEVKVTQTRGRYGGGADMFTVAYRDSDPEIVMKVANELTASVIEENLKLREDQAVGTSDFLDVQLKSMREQLEVVEDRISGYRKNNMGQLPEQLEANLRALDRLQEQLNEKQKSLQDTKNRLILINNQIDTSQRIMPVTSATPTQPNEPLTLNQLKAQLEDLSAKYTDRHPDVVRLKRRIEESEAKASRGELQAMGSSPSSENILPADSVTDRILADQIQQRAEIQFEIRNLESEIPKIQREIIDYQQRVENTPKREEELLGLKRDYHNLQQSYQSLLNRKMEADIAVSMERKQKGEQFRIIDYAQVPQRPISPDMMRLLLFTVAVGLGIGGGLVFLLDFFDTSIRQPDDFERSSGVAVLATIPRIYQRRDVRLRRLNQVFTGISVFIALALFSGFASLTLVGVEPTLELVQRVAKL